MMKNKKDSLGDRMKKYESVTTGQVLVPHVPTVIRLDGKSFHTWAKHCQKPFDTRLVDVFDRTVKDLVRNLPVVIGYTQSDEITLIIYDGGDTRQTPLFDGKLFKLQSVVASMCTAFFNKHVEYYDWTVKSEPELAFFDCRVFNVPNETEAVNCLIWRELDAARNSIQGLGQAYFSHKQLQNKSCNDIQEMLFTEKGVNWNDLPDGLKRGRYFTKYTEDVDGVIRTKIKMLDLPRLTQISNREDVIFRNHKPILVDSSL